ncbi:MAG: amino acid synthesis family protein [Proteobacteria bacterium]|nr:amino acid synthesis family protein [Pseudomonadota bacterium]
MKTRKIATTIENIYSEAGREAGPPLRKVAVIAVIDNPFAGKPYQEDLSSLTEASEALGRTITNMAAEAMHPYAIESYGKASVVGTNGEQQHGSAMVTTLYGNVMRAAAGGGAAWISSTSKRMAAGGIIDVPLAHKDALYVRSHYDTMTIMLPDAPLPNEIAIICCFANRGQLNARVGGLAADDIKGEDGLT